jgi:predicted transcriptional regulator
MAKKLSASQRKVLDLLMESPRRTTAKTALGYISGVSAAALVRLGYVETYISNGERWYRITQRGLDWVSYIKDMRE